MSRRPEKIHPVTALVVGALVLAAGVWLARQWLPEWRGDLPEEAFFVQRYRELARQVGVRLPAGEPRVTLATRTSDDESSEVLDGYDPDLLVAMGAGIRVQVEQEVPQGGKKDPRLFQLQLTPTGQPRAVVWQPVGSDVFTGATEGPPASMERAMPFIRLLLAPGESLGKEIRPEGFARQQQRRYPILGSQPVQHLRVQTPYSDFVAASRRVGPAEPKKDQDSQWIGFLLGIPTIVGIFTVPILFVALVTRRRIDFVNGGILAAIGFLASALSFLRDPSVVYALETLVPAGFLALWAFILWSAAESYLRSVRPGFTTSLDSLRAGRLGPRGGRSILYGLGLGAAVAGLRLAAVAVASALKDVQPEDHSVSLPAFQRINPFVNGVLIAGAIVLTLALVVRFLPSRWAPLPARWAPWVAIVLAAMALTPLEFEPYAASLVANLAMVGLLVFALQRFGATALLAASLAAHLLPVALLSGRLLEWLPFTFAVTAGVPALLLVLGFVGVRRPERVEIERVRQPAFIRRLEEENRVKYEMELLSRMQLGLLPSSLPEVPGWEMAARSLLATEAGGDLYDVIADEAGNLWVANGDVAGHGYSCAIAQAMTVAALTSLIIPGAMPGQVLQGVDRVIRRSGTHRHFTSLALLRIEAESGDALLSNAGHPFPLLLSLGGEVVEIDLPGLPLGQGPKRKYGEICIVIPPGGALVFCSDGLFEGADWQENQYGYDRPQEVLRSLGDASAQEILEALFTDWRRHLGEREHQDDTTVLVIKRK